MWDIFLVISFCFCSYFTPDTYANEHSACAARLAAGLCADLASAIVSGRVKNGFALVGELMPPFGALKLCGKLFGLEYVNLLTFNG